MNKKIAWVTDSTAYIPDELSNHPDLYVIPLSITFSSGTYEDGVTLSTQQLYDNIRREKEVPKTSQPSNGRFAELFETLKEKGYDAAVAVHVSADLSGTAASCRAGAEIAEFPVEVVDSKSMSVAITRLIEIGMQLEEKQIDYKEIAQTLREEARKIENYLLLGSLDQFYKGGRMTGTQYLLGSLLSIKPIIRIFDGKFELFEKVRSEKRATKRLLELFDQANKRNVIEKVYIMHGNVIDKALAYKEELLKIYPTIKEVVVCELTATIGVHAGEGTVALAWANSEAQF